MGRKLARSNQLKQVSKQFSRWGWGASVAALIAGAGIMPVQADQLESWRYDSQARSLTLSLPPNVVPTLSVLAPNRLRVELPNTQVGEVAAQTVADGLVESIALEQATPDTVWMVVDFAEGVVLADAQSAVPTDTAEGLQQWQVRPALTSDSAGDALTADALTTAPSAIALSPADLAQLPDFPELPLLEPAIPLSEPVTVPPIDVRPDTAPIAEVMPADTAAADEATMPLADSVAAPPAADRSEDAIVVSEPEEFPFDPPFLEDMAEPTPLPEAPAVDRLPEELLPSVEADASMTDIPVVAAPADLPADEPVTTVPEVVPEVAPEVTPEPSTANAAAIANAPADALPIAAEPVEADDPIVEIPAESVTPANVSRWPEPIPFGQPLP